MNSVKEFSTEKMYILRMRKVNISTGLKENSNGKFGQKK